MLVFIQPKKVGTMADNMFSDAHDNEEGVDIQTQIVIRKLQILYIIEESLQVDKVFAAHLLECPDHSMEEKMETMLAMEAKRDIAIMLHSGQWLFVPAHMVMSTATMMNAN